MLGDRQELTYPRIAESSCVGFRGCDESSQQVRLIVPGEFATMSDLADRAAVRGTVDGMASTRIALPSMPSLVPPMMLVDAGVLAGSSSQSRCDPGPKPSQLEFAPMRSFVPRLDCPFGDTNKDVHRRIQIVTNNCVTLKPRDVKGMRCETARGKKVRHT
jgi:hypothetical protein